MAFGLPSIPSIASDFARQVRQEHTKLDNLLHDLCAHYNTVKTKWQLKLEVPAGFRQLNSFQCLVPPKTPPRASSASSTISCEDDSLFTLRHITSDDDTVITFNVTPQPSSSINSAILDSSFVPIMRSVDKPSSSLPDTIKMNEDFVRSCVGFRKIETMKKYFNSLYLPSVTLDNTPADAVMDTGHFANMKKKARNTTPVPRLSRFAETIHMDIVFGLEISVGNIHYGLLFPDHFSRMSYMYSLRNLTSDIPKQLQAFFAHIGVTPRRLSPILISSSSVATLEIT